MREWLAHVALLIAALVLSPLMLMYIYVRLRPALLPGEPVFRRDDCAAAAASPQPPPQRPSPSSCHAHPICMANWVRGGRDDVRKILTERGFLALETNTSSSRRSESNTRAVIRVGPDAPLLQYLHHIPHFSEVYFSFFSAALWSCALRQEDYKRWRRRLEKTSQSTSKTKVAVDSLEINTGSRQFWAMKMDGVAGKGAWLRGVVAAADATLGATTVRSSPSPTCPISSVRAYTAGRNPAGWFLHAADAFLLGAHVVGEDPCAHRNSSQHGPGALPSVRVGVLQRRRDRVLLNAAALPRHGPNNVTWAPAFTLEGRPLRAQAAALRALDVVLSVHGAGLANIAWMRPCSVVLEVFPYGYYLPGYFGGLAAAAGLVYRAWHAGSAATVTTALVRDKPHCLRAFAEVNALVQNQHQQQRQPTVAAEAYAEQCFRHVTCRACARGADGVVVDPDFLQTALHELIAQRNQCIRQHPFL